MTTLRTDSAGRTWLLESRLPLDADEFPAQAVEIVRAKFHPGEVPIMDDKFKAALAIQRAATERKK